jgi:hypothetical protein
VAIEADDNADLATMTETVMSLLATIVPASASTTVRKPSKAPAKLGGPISAGATSGDGHTPPLINVGH